MKGTSDCITKTGGSPDKTGLIQWTTGGITRDDTVDGFVSDAMAAFGSDTKGG